MQRGPTFIPHKPKRTVFRGTLLSRTRCRNTFVSVSAESLICDFPPALPLVLFVVKKKVPSIPPFHFPSIHSCNYFLTSPFSRFLSFSLQKGHISNMLGSFDADGRLKVSAFSFLLCCLVWCLTAFCIACFYGFCACVKPTSFVRPKCVFLVFCWLTQSAFSSSFIYFCELTMPV